jgi:hypothetical protein
MASEPYQFVREIRTPRPDPSQQQAWNCEYELADVVDISAQKEWLSLRTQVSPPFPNHPEAIRLAALIRVRDLLSLQIQAMTSP